MRSSRASVARHLSLNGSADCRCPEPVSEEAMVTESASGALAVTNQLQDTETAALWRGCTHSVVQSSLYQGIQLYFRYSAVHSELFW